MSEIVVIDHEGKEHRVEAKPGWTLMELIRDANLPIKADCGGSCSCSTCHVYVDPAWVDRIPAQEPGEADTLDQSAIVQPTSRLSCQIEFKPELDGIKVTLTEDTRL